VLPDEGLQFADEIAGRTVPPASPEAPLAAIGAAERAAPAQLHPRRSPQTEKVVRGPIDQLPSGPVRVQIGYGRAVGIGADLRAVPPRDAAHLSQRAVPGQHLRQLDHRFLALSANHDIEGGIVS
jgi:hypothetical protein